MSILILFVYFAITICSVVYTYLITKNREEESSYVKEVHAHMASIMFFHLSVVALLLVVRPAFLNNLYVSILNTLLSIMFSTLFYFTDKENFKLLYFYNTMYLIFASILMTEIIAYFKMDSFVYAVGLIFVMFVCDLLFYSKERKNKLLAGYIGLSLVGLSMGLVNVDYAYSIPLVAIYGLLVLGYMYYDHDHLNETKERTHLNDALKYFLDFEGMVVRAVDDYLE